MSNNIAGVLFPTDNLSLQQVVSFAKQIEEMDYQSLWIPEFFGRDQVALSALLLGETSKIKVATGISNIYTKDAMAMAQASHTLNEIFPSRFNLGLGVSHSIGAKMRGHEWENPIRKMKQYLLDLFLARDNLPNPKSTKQFNGELFITVCIIWKQNYLISPRIYVFFHSSSNTSFIPPSNE